MDHPTQEELAILKDQRFLIVKQTLSEKVISQLAVIERMIHQEIKSSNFDFPANTFLRSGKISKGENYRSLPYFLLDYPRLFTKTDAFAFRTMLWWGHEFSCTLHLAGKPLDMVRKRLTPRLIKEKDIYFCMNDNPWEYHFESSNYQKIDTLKSKDIENHINKYDFVKISDKVPLEKWDHFGDFSLITLKRFLKLLNS